MQSDAQPVDPTMPDPSNSSPDQAASSSSEPGLKQTSVASTISFVFGVGSLLTLVLVYPAMILAVLAIVFGHIAKRLLKSSRGELLGWGKARVGTLLGYVCLAAAIVVSFSIDEVRLLVRGAIESERTPQGDGGEWLAVGAWGEIERQLVAGDLTEFGNHEFGEALAAAFRRQLRRALNEVLTREGDRGIGLETSGVSCYCHVSQGVCFVASIPELDRYDAAAVDVLKKAAWQAAVIAVQTTEQGQKVDLRTGDGDFENDVQPAHRPPVAAPRNRSLTVGLISGRGCETVMWSSDGSDFNGSPSPETVDQDCSRVIGVINGS